MSPSNLGGPIGLRENMLRVMGKRKYASWKEHLPIIEFAYNRTLHSSIGMSRFEVGNHYSSCHMWLKSLT